eukprot:5869531-Heterocapsa_arctica.AAC.1
MRTEERLLGRKGIRIFGYPWPPERGIGLAGPRLEEPEEAAMVHSTGLGGSPGRWGQRIWS